MTFHPHRSTGARFAAPFALLALLAVAGCGGAQNGPATQSPGVGTPSSGGKTVGVALASMNHNFFIGMRQGVEDQLREDGFTGEFVVADDSASQQQQQVEQLLAKGVSAIIMVPVDAQQAVNPVKAANAAKVPIFCIDRRVTAEGATVTSTIETDNVAMGQMAAAHALELLCKRHGLDAADAASVKKLKATVVHLWGQEAASSAQDRARGFEQVFNKDATPQVKILKAVGNFNPKTSQEVIGPILIANPGVELIFCHNDDNAIGALNAVKDVKKGREAADDPKRILLVSMDGNRPAIEAIRKGEIEATVSQEPIEMGRETVRQVKKLLDGGLPDETYIPVRHHLVTKKEADEKQGELWCDLLKGGV
ncbi:MAG: sugar ABC transporter substrate-binding protein [Actinomycetota bacterium]